MKQFVDNTLSLANGNHLSKKKSLFRSLTTGTGMEARRPFLKQTVNPAICPRPESKVKNSREITEFLTQIVSDQTGIPKDKISPTESLPSYGFDSIAVVRTAQKLSDFLGTPVGAIDIFTASCISELASFVENLVRKSQPLLAPDVSCSTEDESLVFPIEVTSADFGLFATGILQLLGLTYVCFMLLLPAYFASLTYMSMLYPISLVKSSLLSYVSSLVIAPIAWICYVLFTSLSLSILGKSFLQPNYVLTPVVSIWSVDFVKWWALNKAQVLAAKMLAVHLKGTIFLNYWFKMQGARIGSSVVIDTVDITDPSLLVIADGAVIAEGVLIQGHEVRNEVLSFRHVRIGREASIGPYAVLQKGTVVDDGAVVPPLQKAEPGKPTYQTNNTSANMKVIRNI